MKKLLFALVALSFHFQLFAQKSNLDLKKLEPEVKIAIQKAYQSSVSISLYSTETGKAGMILFSGVVVDTAGHVLSVAHAVKPDALYQITFPDGKKLLARGLGRIPSSDAAMLKITTKGVWPYAPMGWSSSMKPDMPCVSISYPGDIYIKTPTVRLGYIAELETRGGYMRSTCLMEPGDSGGPVFDLKGRVIGLHSRIELSLDANLEVPVDLYRKYWNGLLQSNSYVLPPAENPIIPDQEASSLKTVQGIRWLSAGVDKALGEKLGRTTFKIKSPYKRKGMFSNILGTLIKMDGLQDQKLLKNKSFLVSKSSMVSDAPTVELSPGNFVPAKVISRDKANDLVLLQIDQKIKGGVNLKSLSADAVQMADIGGMLVSPRPGDSALISVIGNTQLSIAKTKSSVSIGMIGAQVNDKVIIGYVNPGGSASQSSLFLGDTLLTINGKPLTKVEDLNDEIDSYQSNDTVVFMVARKTARFERKVGLNIIDEPSEQHMAFKFTDGRSHRRSDFSDVLVHDGRLKPKECGGPLYGIDGKFYGINIARLSRTRSLTIPAALIMKFVKTNQQTL